MDDQSSNVLDLGLKTMDARQTTPEHMLRSALEDIRKGERPEKKMVILFLDDEPGNFGLYYYQAGMRLDECAFLCDAGKSLFMKGLGL